MRNAITRFAGAFPMSLFGLTAFAAGKPKVVIDSPTNGQTAHDPVFMKFHVENLRIQSPFAEPADIARADAGHLQITVDGGSWHRIYSTPHPVVIAGLGPGAHRVELVLADSRHKLLDSQTIQFTIQDKNAIPLQH